MSARIDTNTHIRINNLGCENRLPLENERGVKVLEIFVLGEYNSMWRQLWMLPDMSLLPLVAMKINSVKLTKKNLQVAKTDY